MGRRMTKKRAITSELEHAKKLKFDAPKVDNDNTEEQKNHSNVTVKHGAQTKKEKSSFSSSVDVIQGKLGESFYNTDCESLAKNLLGKILVRTLKDGTILKGRIVETECYPGGNDKASVTYNGRVTPKTEPLYMKPGTTFVYLTYGMYNCINISSKGEGAAVLLRAVDPIQGIDYMTKQRLKKRKSNNVKLKLNELCSGPSKLCMSFSIDVESCNKQDLSNWDGLWIEGESNSVNVSPDDIIVSTRIGIDSVGREWAMKPLRFYVFGNESVSKKDKKKEEEKVAF